MKPKYEKHVTTSSKGLAALVLLGNCLAATDATAASIGLWGYSTTSGFDSTVHEASPVAPTTMPGGSAALPEDRVSGILWGRSAGYGQSELLVTEAPDTTSRVLATGSGFAEGSSLVHRNRSIFLTGSATTQAELHADIGLTPLDSPQHAGIFWNAFRLKLLIHETPNVASDCPVLATKCADIAVLLNPQDLVRSFEVDDVVYNTHLDVNGLTALTARQCEVAGVRQGCVGWITDENKETALGLRYEISAVSSAVPEPDTLALISGLVVLCRVRRSRA